MDPLECLVDAELFDLLLFCRLDADCPLEVCPFEVVALFLEDLAPSFWFLENLSFTTCSLLLVERDRRDWLDVLGSAGGADGVLRPRCRCGI